MKRLLVLIGAVVLLLNWTQPSFAQRNARAESKMKLKGKTVSVEYGRPALKGRTVDELLSKLQPGQLWRLGADKSTTFTTGTDLVFADLEVPKGIYSLWARRDADRSWGLVFNRQHGQSGTKHDPAQDLGVTPLKQSKASQRLEYLTIRLAPEGKGGVLMIQWGEMKLSANFRAK